MENIPSLNEIFLYQIKLAENIGPAMEGVWNFFWTWGWIALPFFLWPVVKFQWLYWRNSLWDDNVNKKIILEFRIPNEIVKPIRAMEVVITGLWQLYKPPSWFEKWWLGEEDPSFSFEIVAIDGIPHFLVRLPESQREMFEQHFHAQYPEAEIFEVEDYTKMVPKNVPNKRWELWGSDYIMPGGDEYPIKTYRDFETEREPTEEKRIDPMASLMEGLTKTGEGEQIWIMIKAKPITKDTSDFPERSKKLYEKLAGRKEKPPSPPLWRQILSILTGYPKEEDENGEDSTIPVEMKLTPGERQLVESIESKRTKHLFECFIRHIYIARKEKFSIPAGIKIPMSYFSQFNNTGLGFIIPYTKTITKIKQNWWDWFWMLKKRLYLRKRRIFRNYIRRAPAFYPLVRGEEVFVLGSDELATLFHFPSRISVPPSVIPRVEARKREAPHNLPVEE